MRGVPSPRARGGGGLMRPVSACAGSIPARAGRCRLARARGLGVGRGRSPRGGGADAWKHRQMANGFIPALRGCSAFVQAGAHLPRGLSDRLLDPAAIRHALRCAADEVAKLHGDVADIRRRKKAELAVARKEFKNLVAFIRRGRGSDAVAAEIAVEALAKITSLGADCGPGRAPRAGQDADLPPDRPGGGSDA